MLSAYPAIGDMQCKTDKKSNYINIDNVLVINTKYNEASSKDMGVA